MKKIISILAACTTLLAVSCNKDNPETPPGSDFDPTSLKAFNTYMFKDYHSVVDTITNPYATVFLYQTQAKFKEVFNELTSEPEMESLSTVVEVRYNGSSVASEDVKTYCIFHFFTDNSNFLSGPWNEIPIKPEIIICKPETFTVTRNSKTITIVDQKVVAAYHMAWVEECSMNPVPAVLLDKAFELVQMRDKEMPATNEITLCDCMVWHAQGTFNSPQYIFGNDILFVDSATGAITE